ncbi:hypothetical protein D3Z48_13035 [Clostridiaceae bacterium]|nr:hypothetical protein [Clostridiaceae bacterium]
MTKNAENFLHTLVERYKDTGKKSFNTPEYMGIAGYSSAIDELSDRGIIIANKDIVGTIVLSEDLLHRLTN